MAAKTPIALVLGELENFQTGDFIAIANGGTGATTVTGAQTALSLLPGTNVQAWDADLDAIAAFTGTGITVRTGTNTWAQRALTAPAAGLTITNNDGSAGSPTFALANDIGAIEALTGSGFLTRTGTDTWALRVDTGTAGRIVVTNGDGVAGNATWDLATVGSAVTAQFVKITTDAYGRVTATTAVGSSDITGSLGYTPVNKAGDSMTGNLILNADPTAPLGAATKQYVDANVQGLQIKPTARVATTAALPTNTYSNGTAGNGATLTASANGVLTVDGVATALGDYILVKNEATPANNGLYQVTTAGAAGTPYVLTRHIDMDTTGEFSGAFIPVGNAGTANANSLWLANPSGTVTVGTTSIPFTQLNGATDIIQGNGITISGNTISVAFSSRVVNNGGLVDLQSGVVTPGTYTKLTVDTYGRVTTGATAVPSDIGAQPVNSNLTAISGLTGAGIPVETATGSYALRTLAAPSEGLTITNPAGTAGNPTFAFANDLGAIELLNTNGILARTATDTWASRTIVGAASSARITVTNGDGIAGNPAIDLVSGVATPGTYTSVTVDTYGRVTAGTNPAAASDSGFTLLTNAQGSTINIGQAVYASASGSVSLAQANGSASKDFVGFVSSTSITNGASGNITVTGIVTASTAQWDAVTGQSGGLTAGARYYLSATTAGQVTTTPAASGWVVEVGVAISSTKLEIKRSRSVRN